MATAIEYTPTQQRIIDLLSDGQPHSRSAMHACLQDELAEKTSISFHVSKLRQLLRPLGQDIICVRADGRVLYQHVKVVPIGRAKR